MLTRACWGIALTAGDVEWGQVSYDVLIQLPILAAVALYYPRARQYVADKLMILMKESCKHSNGPAIGRAPADAELPANPTRRETVSELIERF